MRKTLFSLLLATTLCGCGREISGTYKQEAVGMPNASGLPIPAAQQAMLNKALDSQRTILEFGPGKKVAMKTMAMTQEWTYRIEGQRIKIMLAPNAYMELTIEGDALVGPGGMRFVKQ